MEFHYNKHHRAYVNNLNNFQEQSSEALARGDIKKYIELSHLVKFNGGGHLNHEFFWESLAPLNNGGGAHPDKGTALRDMLDEEYGSMDNFQDFFSKQTASL